jgi:hypothetical protein
VAGTLDIHAMHRASMAPLMPYPAAQLAAWAAQFEQAMASTLAPSRLALVQRHRAAGDLRAIVSATTPRIAEPFARLFGVAELVATEADRKAGALTGEIAGDPCFATSRPAAPGNGWRTGGRASRTSSRAGSIADRPATCLCWASSPLRWPWTRIRACARMRSPWGGRCWRRTQGWLPAQRGRLEAVDRVDL